LRKCRQLPRTQLQPAPMDCSLSHAHGSIHKYIWPQCATATAGPMLPKLSACWRAASGGRRPASLRQPNGCNWLKSGGVVPPHGAEATPPGGAPTAGDLKSSELLKLGSSGAPGAQELGELESSRSSRSSWSWRSSRAPGAQGAHGAGGARELLELRDLMELGELESS
jgi:hypothetical protein